MTQQDFQPHADEDNTPDHLHPGAQPVADPVADKHTCKAEAEGDQPNDHGRGKDGDVQKSKGYTHCHGVDAGGDGQAQQHDQVQGIAFLLHFIYPDGFIDHF